MPTRQRQTVDALIRAYNTADIATIRTLFSKSCVFRKLPKNLSIKPYNYDVFIEHTRNSLKQFTQYQVIANEITEDTQAGRIVVRQTTTTGTPGVAALFSRETIWTFRFDEAGAKVVELTEFMGREPGY